MTSPLKVLHVTYSLKVSGIETLVTNLHKYVDKSNVQFDFAVYCDPNIEEHYDKDVLTNGGRIYKLGIRNNNKSVRNIISERLNFYKLLKNEKYDIIHIHASSGMHLVEGYFAKLSKIPNIVIHSHSSKITSGTKYFQIKKLMHYSLKWLWPFIATEYIACSDEAAKWLFPKRISTLRKYKLLKNGIDTERYIYSEVIRRKLREEFGISDKFVVGHVGRFSKIKNHSFLIDVFKEIYRVNPSAVLILVGQGELEDSIKAKVSELGLNDAVFFLGVRKDIPDLLQAMDIIVFPSLFEGLPIVGIESQAAGLPVVASNTITREMNLTDDVKYLSLNQTNKEWAIEVFNHYEKTKRKDTSSIIREQGFDIQLAAKQLEKLYDQLKGVKNETI